MGGSDRDDRPSLLPTLIHSPRKPVNQPPDLRVGRARARGESMSSEFIIQQLMSGVAIGLAYALIAIGYSMVYGILKFINFGHGAVYMVGTYVVDFAWKYLNQSMAVWPIFRVAVRAVRRTRRIQVHPAAGDFDRRFAGRSRLTT